MDLDALDTLQFLNLIAKRSQRYSDWVRTGMKDQLEPLYTSAPDYFIHDSNKCEGYDNQFVMAFAPDVFESTLDINQRLIKLLGYEPYWILFDAPGLVYLCLKTQEEVALAKLTLDCVLCLKMDSKS
jgi:hypothetical protein